MNIFVRYHKANPHITFSPLFVENYVNQQIEKLTMEKESQRERFYSNEMNDPRIAECIYQDLLKLIVYFMRDIAEPKIRQQADRIVRKYLESGIANVAFEKAFDSDETTNEAAYQYCVNPRRYFIQIFNDAWSELTQSILHTGSGSSNSGLLQDLISKESNIVGRMLKALAAWGKEAAKVKDFPEIKDSPESSVPVPSFLEYIRTDLEKVKRWKVKYLKILSTIDAIGDGFYVASSIREKLIGRDDLTDATIGVVLDGLRSEFQQKCMGCEHFCPYCNVKCDQQMDHPVHKHATHLLKAFSGSHYHRSRKLVVRFYSDLEEYEAGTRHSEAEDFSPFYKVVEKRYPDWFFQRYSSLMVR